MSLAVYVHIPYCLQRCTYCDFATYEQSKIMPPAKYIELINEEVQQTYVAHETGFLKSLYFGGGTPSLLPATDIVSIIRTLANHGFVTGPDSEVTIEINPATIDERKMEIYLENGVNRFSVGAQTFNDSLLKSVNREHSAQQTRDTLALLNKFKVNFSFDILFSLPGQTLDILRSDLDEVIHFQPNHISPYCLTVPEGHVLSKIRPLEEVQLKMFDLIKGVLLESGYQQYEISNFAKEGYESVHNSAYWDDSSYWGIGLSSHSYWATKNWGRRYWNPSSIGAYEEMVLSNRGKKFYDPGLHVPVNHREDLLIHQSLTDYCHIFLRTKNGLDLEKLKAKFGFKIFQIVSSQIEHLIEDGLVEKDATLQNIVRLSEEGIVLSNQVFQHLTYLQDELA